MEFDRFLRGANPVIGMALAGDVVILVVDDQEDDDLVAEVAQEVGADVVPSQRFGGGWSSQAKFMSKSLLLKFHLIRFDGEMERQWTVPEAPPEILDTISGGSHYVAVLPRELAGNLADVNPASVGGAMIVQVDASEAVSKARVVLTT
jgi:hypothetical protein